MNACFDDDEFTAMYVESRGSEPNKQSNDPPPEFTGTQPSEFKSYRKRVRLWLLLTRTPAQLRELHTVLCVGGGQERQVLGQKNRKEL